MKVRLLVARAGADFSQNRGDVIEVSAAEGERMIEAGQAEILRQAAAPEKAVRAAAVEKATKG
jgi:F0F1-type ATP synthase membrane subunit b/b'